MGYGNSRNHYRKNKDYYLERNRRRRAEFKVVIDEHRSKPCADCGVEYPPYVMDFDHLRDKKFNISRLSAIYSLKALLEEIAKCDIVCSNCHRARTYRRGRSENATAFEAVGK